MAIKNQVAKAKKKQEVPRQGRRTREREPEYMINIPDPTMVRKEILEAVRETILFMQGSEDFHTLQQEKVALFASLKRKIGEINGLVDRKLRRFMPKGKLKPLLKHEKKDHFSPSQREEKEVPPISQFDDFEEQLKDIEGRLQHVS